MRSGSFGEGGFGFGEPELDANTALTELDKGLRSTKLGEQVEAIVRFPALFERYPFPILINSAFLKLADVFRTGSNFLRLWVLRVCQQSERHLDKILNVDEFIRRIFSVIYANDPIARALTLRTLGSLAGLIHEKKPVHHSIRVALDSHDKVEVSAAIFAASCFAQRSKTFGTTMYMKIASMVQRLSTPIDLKLRLIPIFQHMHHDAATTSMVRKLCLDLLINYPSQEFVTTILHTLTQLAASTISDLTEQVAFLLSYLEDSRTKVKLSVLRDLKFLGERGGHLWESNHIVLLIDAVINKDTEKMETDEIDAVDAEIMHSTLNVVSSVTSSSAIIPFVHAPDSQLQKVLESSIHSTDMTIALKAIQIATQLAINWKDNRSGTSLIDTACRGVESLLTSLCSQTLENSDESFKKELFRDLEKCLANGGLLCKADSSKCDWFCNILIRLFKIQDVPGSCRNLLAQAIGSIGSWNVQSIQKILPEILNILKKMDKKMIEEENCTVATLVAIVFQAHQGHTLNPKCHNLIYDVLKSSNLWLAYRMARNSLRFGQPEIAVEALKAMTTSVSSENFHYWLSSLLSVATAETMLSDFKGVPKMISRINQSSSFYMQAVASIKAASSPTLSLQFQIEYLKIRSEMLVAFSNFLVSCNTLQLSPPAAIAQSIAVVMRDELLKSGRVVSQLRKSIRDFQGISEMYGRLYQTAFDADNDSLLNIQILQQLCRLVARSIEKQVVSKDHPSFSDDNQSISFFMEASYENSGNSWSLIQSCKQAIEILSKIQPVTSQGISFQHIECLREATRVIIETPMPYPRFFFQTLQMTRVKIAVSPQPRNIGEAVTVLHGNNLALKVEGVIQQNSAKSGENSKLPTVFRKPKSIRLTVISTPLPNPRAHLSDSLKMNQEPITLVKDVIPHRDFFQSQFLLMIAPGGLTNVTVDTSLVDFEGRVWMTGPRAQLSVKVFDDPSASSKQQQQQTANMLAAASGGPGPSRQLNTGGIGQGNIQQRH